MRPSRKGAAMRMWNERRVGRRALCAVGAAALCGAVVFACGSDEPPACEGPGCADATADTGAAVGDAGTDRATPDVPDAQGGEGGDAVAPDGGADAGCQGQPGTLDPGFGDGGVVWIKAPTSGAFAVAVQADQKIVLGGYTGGSAGKFALARLLPSGTPDPSFGTNGIAERAIPGNISPSIRALALQPDGKIVAAGIVRFVGSESDIVLMRYLTNGEADPSFGAEGVVLTDFSGRSDRASSLAIQPDGRLVVGGQSGGATASDNDYAIVRYNVDGSLDASFGVGGKMLVDIRGTADVGGYVALAPGGRIAIAGHSLATTSNTSRKDLAMAVVQSSGLLESGFADGGRLVANVGGAAGILHQVVRSLAVDGRGNYLLAGSYGSDFATTRVLTNGVLDPSFGVDGTSLTDFGGSGDDAFAVLPLANGSVVTVGEGNTAVSPPDTSIQIARHLTGGATDALFGASGRGKVVPQATTNYGSEAAALSACGVVVVGVWGLDNTTTPDTAIGVARFRN